MKKHTRIGRAAKRSKSLITRIVTEFSRSRFQPLTVAKVGDHFAIIDGQHRAIAAATHPSIASVPCWVVPHDELRLKCVCETAGIVVIARHNTLVRHKADHTVAVSTIDGQLRKVGDGPVIAALQALRQAYPLKDPS